MWGWYWMRWDKPKLWIIWGIRACLCFVRFLRRWLFFLGTFGAIVVLSWMINLSGVEVYCAMRKFVVFHQFFYPSDLFSCAQKIQLSRPLYCRPSQDWICLSYITKSFQKFLFPLSPTLSRNNEQNKKKMVPPYYHVQTTAAVIGVHLWVFNSTLCSDSKRTVALSM